ncbi:MAG TPA: thiamine pyrophosphate-dependent enzyme, partial [Polyangiaceae bacterium]|nr:thiamine pyrophosphate-dependent enzyme [Polyangiaceae bacterium]
MDEFGINSGYVAEKLDRYLHNPESVDENWRRYFENRLNERPSGQTNGNGVSHGLASARTANGLTAATTDGATPALMTMVEGQGHVAQLINAYRTRGHLFARVDPLRLEPAAPPQLDLANFGLTEADLDRTYSTVDMAGPKEATLREIIARLETTYCRSIGAEFTQVEDPEERAWLQDRMESTQNRLKIDRDAQVRILTKLTDAEILEQFIHKNFVGAKRFSLEGAESLIPLLDLLVETSGQQGVAEIVIGMAHRGRLNVLANILNKNIREIFAAFEDGDPQKFLGSGDVKYHLGYSTDYRTLSGQSVHLTLAFNPSHLEWVNPVVEGRVRAKQDRRGDRDRKVVMPLLIHGDAAFIGQGVVPETLNLAGLEGYTTGGTIHVVVNNQIGFTTMPTDARSTRYATDIVRMLKVPVFHVNGEDPEAVGQVTKLAIEFRQLFGKDVVVDMYCYRRYGHNEADEPRFTQPLM